MTLEDFVARREAERAWAYANGYNNGDAATNGEYACLDALLAEADVFVDVGANEGLFAARAAARTPAPKILAFEPNPAHRALIETRLAGAGRLEGVALGDQPGSATLHIHATHHATASLTEYGWVASWNSTTVPNGTYTLQSLASYGGEVSGTSPGVTITVSN